MGNSNSFPIEEFRQIHGPIVDIRSPIEFKKGHWPGAKNIPLFNDEERSAIGTSYKKQGRDRAILLGLECLSPKLSSLKEALEIEYKTSTLVAQEMSSNRLKIYCWRGGMRSRGVSWLAELLELKPVMLEGGYKAYRQWVLKQFEQNLPIKLLGGKTGTGKTDLLLALARKGASVIDLEGLARHRGSSFGSLGLPTQPSTEHFENKIAETINTYTGIGLSSIWIEAESANLGKCRVPNSLFKQMKEAPLVEITRSDEERVKQLIDVYASQPSDQLKDATLRISKRLGPQRTAEALDAITQKDWGRACRAMLDYYDRCYEHELSRVEIKQKLDISGKDPDHVADILINLGNMSQTSFRD